MGLGSDWSPSGSKNLFGELKVARLVSAALGNVFSDGDLVAMATRNAAAILKWDKALGSVEAGKHADLLVVTGMQGDAYAHLLEARETDITLVMVGGVPRYGKPSLMTLFGAGTESWKVGGKVRALNLAQQTADPVVGALKLAEARDRLKDGMQRLPELARNLENPPLGALRLEPAAPQWFLVLDHDEPAGVALRPHLPFGAARTQTATMPLVTAEAVAAPLSEILEPLELDPLTVADDAAFLDGITQELNLPLFVVGGLADLY
jgi:5-methylthioadenosine/S-adenosylhomocysteine deaminase